MEIPTKVLDLQYTTHAQAARCTDKMGFVARVPVAFHRVGCKNCVMQPDGVLRVTYIYDDTRDLVLIINPEQKMVVTLYFTVGKNVGVLRGRFFYNFNRKVTS